MENVASRFGQRLAHTEKKYRDQALKKLSAYLAKRTQWSALEWDKLWKALFYCMWMSDKRAVQDELSTNLSRLVHTIPAVDDALGFCHSFFRTMHREWHGIDGLRLDKFYSLIRKFVHETLLLLRRHDWDRALVERVVSILSSEIMSQLPNGLRLHVTDLFLTELHGAAGDDVDTTTFLLLLEPFFTLLSSEYDKTVFKRVRELVFLPLLSKYAFGPQPEKGNKKTESDELHDTDKEDDGDDDDAPKVFAEVELPFVQHRIFAIASADDTAERNRSVLYELYSHFYKVTKIDSLKASQDATLAPKARKAASKKRKEPEAEPVAPETDESAESKKKKKNKRRKKTTPSEEEANAEMAEAPKEADEQVVVTPEKKSKKSNATKTPVNTPVKTPAVEDETPTKKSKKKANVEDVIMEAAKALEEATPESVKKSKKDKKKKAAETKEEEEEAVETPTKKSKKDKKNKVKIEEMEEEVVETPTKKEKKAIVEVEEVEAVKEETAVSKKSKKDKKKVKAEEEMLKKVEEEVAAALEQVALSKKADKTSKVKVEAKVETNETTPSKKKDKKQKADAEAVQSKEAKGPKPETVTRSGMKFRRCAGCGGIGKGLVPVGKDCCRHCERTGQLKKKALVADKKKKRKADELAASAVAQEPEAPSKKVTFGKNRALAHELSVKRLKASKTVVKELTSDIKGVLKAGATSSATNGTKQALKSKKRMKAADFF